MIIIYVKMNHGSLLYDWTMDGDVMTSTTLFRFKNRKTACNCVLVSILAIEPEFFVK